MQKNIVLKYKIISIILLFTATVCWGLNFVFQQNASKYIGPFTFLFLRTLIGSVMVFFTIIFKNLFQAKKAVFWQKTDSVKKTLKGGLITGLCITAVLFLQQVGVSRTTVGKAGFLTSTSVIFVPFIGITLGRKVKLYQWIGIITSLIGIALISLTDVSMINIGDIITLISAAFAAVHIITAGYYSKTTDSLKLSFFRFLSAAAISFVVMVLFEGFNLKKIYMARNDILFAGILASGIAFTFFAISQKYLSDISVSLLLSLQSIFAAIFGAALLGETLTFKETAGCVILFVSVVMMQIYDELKALITTKPKTAG